MKVGDEFDGGTVTEIGEPSLDKDNENVKDVTVKYPKGLVFTHVVNTVTENIIYHNIKG